MDIGAILDAKMMEKKFEAAQEEFKAAQEEYRRAILQKNTDLEAYDRRNKELERWVKETQEKLEQQIVSKVELADRMEKMKAEYWEQARTNYEKLDKRLEEYEKAREHIAALEQQVQQQREMLEKHTTSLQATRDQQGEEREQRRRERDRQLEALIDSKLAKVMPQPPSRIKYKELLTKLSDDTPLF